MSEIQERMKAGADWHSPEVKDLMEVALKIQNGIVEGMEKVEGKNGKN
jgi:hypothetical protein